MSRSFKHEFTTPLLVTICGVEEEYEVRVAGTFHPAQGAFTYRGEMAATDPPEPESFEWSSATATIEGKPVNLLPFLSGKQRDALDEEGRLSALGAG